MQLDEEFVTDLKNSIEKTDRQKNNSVSTYYKPSSMKCIRNMYFQASGTAPDPSDKPYTLIGICDSGTDIHVRIQKSVEDMIKNNYDCEYIDVASYIAYNDIKDVIVKDKVGMETKLYSPKYNMSFMCDGIIKYKGKYYILEIKTETASKFLSREGVAEEHISQATAYSLTLGIDDVMFLYVCRDNLDLKAILYQVTDSNKVNLINLIDSCNEYVKSNIVPPKPVIHVQSVCRYCNYKSKCEKFN